MTQIDALMRDLLDTEYELTAHEKTLDGLFQQVSRNENIVRLVSQLSDCSLLTSRQEGVIEMYENGVQQRLEAYKQKTARQKYAKSDQYHKFKQAIYVSRTLITIPIFLKFCLACRRCNIQTRLCHR